MARRLFPNGVRWPHSGLLSHHPRRCWVFVTAWAKRPPPLLSQYRAANRKNCSAQPSAWACSMHSTYFELLRSIRSTLGLQCLLCDLPILETNPLLSYPQLCSRLCFPCQYASPLHARRGFANNSRSAPPATCLHPFVFPTPPPPTPPGLEHGHLALLGLGCQFPFCPSHLVRKRLIYVEDATHRQVAPSPSP